MVSEQRGSHLSPVMVMVKPSYSFPGSFMLVTLELTVNPSLVLLLNCFREQTHAHAHTHTHTHTHTCINPNPYLTLTSLIKDQNVSDSNTDLKKTHLRYQSPMGNQGVNAKIQGGSRIFFSKC